MFLWQILQSLLRSPEGEGAPSIAGAEPPTPSAPTTPPAPTPTPTTPTDPATPPAPEAKPDPATPEPPKGGTIAGGEDEPKPEGEPKKDEPKPEDAVPEGRYEIKLPDGAEPDERMYSTFETWAKANGVPQGQAQKFVDAYVEITKAQTEQWSETVTSWADQAKKDPVFGGPKFEENVAHIQRVVAEFGDPELRKISNDLGFGNHPAYLRLLLKVAQATGEGRAPAGAPQNAGGEITHAQVLYGNRSGGKT